MNSTYFGLGHVDDLQNDLRGGLLPIYSGHHPVDADLEIRRHRHRHHRRSHLIDQVPLQIPADVF